MVTTIWTFVTPRLCNMAGWVRASRVAASEFFFTHIVLRPATSSVGARDLPALGQLASLNTLLE
jgi:hypothetical protein